MIDFYNLFIYDVSFKLRTNYNLNFNLACDLNIGYTNVDKNSAVVQPAIRGAHILDSLALHNNLRANYSYYSNDFKSQTINLNLFLNDPKLKFFTFFHNKIINDSRMQTELFYQSKFNKTFTNVSLINLNVLMKALDEKNEIAISGIDFGENLNLKFFFFNKRKNHAKLLMSLMGLIK